VADTAEPTDLVDRTILVTGVTGQVARPLAIALALILGLMAGEVVFGFAAGSLALLADAGHMLTDAIALGLALVAATYATRPPRGRWTFGFRRLEILAAHVNGLLLVAVGVVIVYTAIRRLVDPPEVRGGIVLVVALVGIAVNLVTTGHYFDIAVRDIIMAISAFALARLTEAGVGVAARPPLAA